MTTTTPAAPATGVAHARRVPFQRTGETRFRMALTLIDSDTDDDDSTFYSTDDEEEDDVARVFMRSGTRFRHKQYDSTCSICFENYKTGDHMFEYRCGNRHVFHESCLRRWAHQKNSKRRCPICRAVPTILVSDDESDEEEEEDVEVDEERGELEMNRGHKRRRRSETSETNRRRRQRPLIVDSRSNSPALPPISIDLGPPSSTHPVATFPSMNGSISPAYVPPFAALSPIRPLIPSRSRRT